MLEHDSEASPASENGDEAPAASLDETSAGASPAAGVTEGSPPSDDKEAPPKSLLDVISNVVEPAKMEAPEETSASETVTSDDAKTPEGEQELSEEELAKLPFGKHPRFKKVLGERNAFKQQASEFQAQVQELEGPAGQYQRIDGFLRNAGIQPAEFVELMQVGALLKNDPEAARQELIRRLIDLDKITGHALPEDLRKDVEEGRLEEQRARELSIARAREARATETAKVATTHARHVEQSTQVERFQGEVVDAVSGWEQRTRASDPDFAAKEELIADRVIALNARLGPPKSAEDAVRRAEQAHKAVTDQLKGMLPPKPEVVRRNPGSHSTSNVAADPKSMLDVVNIALASGA